MNLVFAYGSNMHHGQLYKRCPAARVVCTGTLSGWSLAFVGRGVATILRRQGNVVPGLLVELNDRDFAVLNRFEGVPHVYEQRRVHVHVQDAGIKFVATAYVHRAAAYSPPTYDYFARILAGAIMNDLPTEHIIDAANEACSEFVEIAK